MTYRLAIIIALLAFAGVCRAEPLDLSKGGVIHLPAGTFELEAPVAFTKPTRIIGEGMGLTTIKVTFDSDYALSFEQHGERRLAYCELRDLTIRGGGHEVDAIWLENVVRSAFNRVEIIDFKGSALHAVQHWDSAYSDCVFARCGTEGRPMVVLADARPWIQKDGTPAASGNTNCNNLSFWGCAFDNNAYTSLWLGKGCTKVRLVSCKFHGELPIPVACNHIEMHGAFSNVVTACNITNGGAVGIVLDKADGNVITSNLISGQRGGGILDRGKSNVIEANEFPGNWEAKNGEDRQ